MLNADFRATPRRPIQSIVDHGVMSRASEQGHSAIRKRQQAFALKLASINGTTCKALGPREPMVENLVHAFRRNMRLATKVSHQLAALAEAFAAARTMAETGPWAPTELIQGCLFFLYDVLRLVKHGPKWYAPSEIERPSFLVNFVGLDIPSHKRYPPKVDVERVPREANTALNALLDRQPRLPPDFIATEAARVSLGPVVLDCCHPARPEERGYPGRAAHANDKNKGAARRKRVAKNNGAAKNLNDGARRRGNKTSLASRTRADKKATVGNLGSSNKRPRSAMEGEGVIEAKKGTGEATAHSGNQRAKRTRASEKGAERNRRSESEESAEHPRGLKVVAEVKEEVVEVEEEEVEVEEAEIVEEEAEGMKEEEVKGEEAEVKVEAEEMKVEVEEVKVEEAEVKAEDTPEAPTDKDDQEMEIGVREMDVDDKESGNNDHIIGDDQREMGNDDQEMDYVEEMLALGGERVRETPERSLEIAEQEEQTYPTWTVYTEPSADERDREDDDEDASDSGDFSESDEDAEDQLAPMSSSPPPFEKSRKRAMPRPARIPSPPWQMSGI